jgi:hypothetical protein
VIIQPPFSRQLYYISQVNIFRLTLSPHGQTDMTIFKQLPLLLSAMALLTAVSACTPTVKVAAPDEPITINLNVKIEHEVRVRIDKDLDEVFSKESGLF